MPAPHTTSRRPAWSLAIGALATTLAGLSGCASVMRVDSQVQSHAQWAPSALPTGLVSYTFERLPSQSQGPVAVQQAALESMTQTALATRGWQPIAPTANPATAPWRVQVLAQAITLPRAPWEEPGGRLWPRWGVGLHNGGASIQFNGLLHIDTPYHLRRVTVVVRDGHNGRVAFETTASHEGRWNDHPALWQAMLEAALRDFPHPPAGVRQIDIDLPR